MARTHRNDTGISTGNEDAVDTFTAALLIDEAGGSLIRFLHPSREQLGFPTRELSGGTDWQTGSTGIHWHRLVEPARAWPPGLQGPLTRRSLGNNSPRTGNEDIILHRQTEQCSPP